MIRLSPSRTSTVFRSLSRISRVSCSSRFTLIGLLAGAPESREVFLLLSLILRLLNGAALKGLVERRQHLAAGVGDQHVVLDADAALAGQVDARLDRDDHPGPQLFLAAGLPEGGQLVDLPADAVAEP